MCLATSSGTTNVASGSQPSVSFVARTSAPPSGAPGEAAASPWPSEETTPPVMNMYRAMGFYL